MGKNKRDDIRALIDSGLSLNNTQSNLLLVTWQREFFEMICFYKCQ